MSDEVVKLLDSEGNVSYTKAADVAKAEALGYRRATEADNVELARLEGEDEFFSSPEQVAKAGIGSFLGGATLGASDLLSRATDSQQEITETRKGREHNRTLSTVANIAGGFLPAAATGGLAAAAAKRLGGGIIGSGAGMALEGGLYGGGAGLSEAALSDDPLTIERVASSVGHGALTGALTGGAIGIAGKAAALGASKARNFVGELKAGMRGAEASANVADDVAKYVDDVRTANPFQALDSGQASADLIRTRKVIEKALKDPEGLRRNPTGISKALREQANALDDAIKRTDEIAGKIAERDAKLVKELGEELLTLPDASETVELSGKLARRYSGWADVKVPKDAGIAVPRAEANRFMSALESGEAHGASRKALDGLGDLVAKNKVLRDSLDAAASANKPGMVEDMLKGSMYSTVAGAVGSVPFVGPFAAPIIAAKASGKLTDLVMGRMAKAAAESSVRTDRAVEAIMSAGSKAYKTAPVLASKVLSSTSYAPAEKAALPVAKATIKPASSLHTSFKAREKELRSQTTVDMTGQVVVHPEARKAIAERLEGVRAVAPLVADKLETMAARKIEFLANKLPKRPDLIALQAGPDRWQPSELDVRAFARYAAAAEDPDGVEARLASGTVTPEDAEAYQAIYPERFADLKQRIAMRLPELQQSLPYERRVSLSIFTGIPVDPAMHPQIIAQLQSMYTDEPGTEGGMTPPQAQPAFGSVSKPDPTAAQKRAG